MQSAHRPGSQDNAITEGPRPPFRAAPEYYAYVAGGYDRIVHTYDEVEAGNRVGRRLRTRFQELLTEAFAPGDRIVDIGCGTGIEAILLAGRGVRVLATDVSEGMLGRVQEKAALQGLQSLRAMRLAARELGSLADEFGRGWFDGAYSHGAVLNMDPDLDAVAEGLAVLLKPSGRFLCTLVNQTSLFEVLFYLAVLRPRKAFRRLGNVVPIPITRHEAHRRFVVPSRFYSPGAFLRHFSRWFRFRRRIGLGIVTAPWNLSEEMDRFEPAARIAEAADDILSEHAPFNSWGNVVILDLERR